ncbi:hypothetical protein RB195_016694 [Necator americanus]|uniref:BPTI/Kunitz inhibitor domain-containing protein n=1 Tax=Necator americanus TaxID=51031 RepID=A0ABR1C1P8_NECAM
MRTVLLLMFCVAVCVSYAPREYDCYAPKHLPGIRCMARMLRFAYNPQKNDCEPFHYGGCRPSKNNFRTMEHCRRSCLLKYK